MLISEAAQLVLQADLIRLSGFEPGGDIALEVIGLRPGERLNKTLVMDREESARLHNWANETPWLFLIVLASQISDARGAVSRMPAVSCLRHSLGLQFGLAACGEQPPGSVRSERGF